jgi:hypothetical protein
MAAESGFIQLAGAFWEWLKQDVNLWARAVGDLKSILAEQDLDTDDALKFALRFSALSILIALLASYPAVIFFLPHDIPPIQIAAIFLMYYVIAFLCALGSKIMAIVVRSKTSMRRCFILALMATAYWPLCNLLDYITYSDEKVYRILMLGELGNKSVVSADIAKMVVLGLLVGLAIYLYVFTKLISASRYIFGVGRFRAAIIVLGPAAFQMFFQLVPLKPFFEAVTKVQFND